MTPPATLLNAKELVKHALLKLDFSFDDYSKNLYPKGVSSQMVKDLEKAVTTGEMGTVVKVIKRSNLAKTKQVVLLSTLRKGVAKFTKDTLSPQQAMETIPRVRPTRQAKIDALKRMNLK